MRRDDRRAPSARLSTLTAVAGTLALLLPAAAVGQQDAGEVLRESLDRYEERLEGVESVTVVQEVVTPMGTSGTSTLRLAAVTRDGRTFLVPEGESGPEDVGVASIYASLEDLMDRSVLRGRSRVDGREVWVVAMTDLQGLDLGEGALSTGPGGAFRTDSATLYLDAAQYVVRRADVHGEATMGGADRSVSLRAHFRDYRESDGLLHPYRTEAEVEIEGMGAQMQAMMKKMQKMQQGADSAQRAMMEKAMGAMMGDGMTVTTTVKELRVDRGDGSGGR